MTGLWYLFLSKTKTKGEQKKGRTKLSLKQMNKFTKERNKNIRTSLQQKPGKKKNMKAEGKMDEYNTYNYIPMKKVGVGTFGVVYKVPQPQHISLNFILTG